MIVKDLFDFLNPDLKKRERYLPLLTDVSAYDDGRRILLHSGFEKHKNVEDLNKDVLNGYYVYYCYAHFDDELFLSVIFTILEVVPTTPLLVSAL